MVTGSRADYGLLRGILTRLRECAGIDLQVVACGMHLAARFGETWRAIEADGFTLSAKVDLELGDDTPQAVARSTGIGTVGFTEAFQSSRRIWSSYLATALKSYPLPQQRRCPTFRSLTFMAAKSPPALSMTPSVMR